MWEILYNFFVAPVLGILGVMAYVGGIIAILGICFIILRAAAWVCGVRAGWDEDDDYSN